MSWRESVDLVNGLIARPGTNLNATEVGWKFPMTQLEILQTVMALVVTNALLPKGAEPVKADWPWADVRPEDIYSPAEREEFKQRLERRSAFAA